VVNMKNKEGRVSGKASPHRGEELKAYFQGVW